MMKASEIRKMSDEELGQELLERRREQFNLRMQAASGQGVRPDQFGKVRKDIARLKTVMRERESTEKVDN
jgi:large subunit ribosomal protein L29